MWVGEERKKRKGQILFAWKSMAKHLLTAVGTGEIHSEWKFIPMRLRRGGELALTEEWIHIRKLKAEGSNWGPRRHSQESFHLWGCWEARDPWHITGVRAWDPNSKVLPTSATKELGSSHHCSGFWKDLLSVRSCHLCFAVIGCRNSWDGLPCQLQLTAANGLRELWAIVHNSTGTGVCGAGSSGFLNW